MKYSPVPVPECCVFTKTGSATYVYLTKSVAYSKEKKRTVPTRVLIGKLNDDGMLVPNHNYVELFGEKKELVPSPERADFVSCGLHMILERIAEELQLNTLLEGVFDKEVSDLILDVASYMIHSEDNVMQYVDNYCYGHDLFSDQCFEDSAVGKLMNLISVKDIDTFIRAWVNMHVSDGVYISYDSTNMNTVAGNLELAEYGYAKDNPDLPQVNMSLAYNQSDDVPLFYEMYPGSITDNTECQKMVDRAKYYGCENVGFILDRGYFSLDNIRYFEKNRLDYILMTKGNAKFVKEVIEEVGPSVSRGARHYLPEYELFGMTVEKQLFHTGTTQYIHVYYDSRRAGAETIEINNRFHRMDTMLEEKKARKIQRKEDVKSYEKYYNLRFDDNGYFLAYQRKDSEIEKLVDQAGYFVIITSKKMTAKEALDVYRNRDAVEKVFRMDKSFLGNDVFRVHSQQKLESKMFISFVALILRNCIHNKTKELYRSNRGEFTVPRIIRTLENLGVTKLSDDRYHLRYQLTSKQKKILKQFGMDESAYKSFANRLSAKLR